ncbi:hypothetical protein [Paraliobacillus zengyii]|uniref:hypothetical protein n=1 Tax=Paraliobacillus zengyii TaxID=2213194 RepID=UPI000DD3659A|nr:hypothetical protein [Paraliobacillus zengyii]
MLEGKRLQIAMGTCGTLFVVFAMLTNNEELLSVPFLQYLLGFIAISLLLTGISVFRKNSKKTGVFLSFMSLFIIGIILFNNTITIKGFMPLIVLGVFATIPFVIFYLVTHFSKNKSRL